jgi:hypothetical protein
MRLALAALAVAALAACEIDTELGVGAEIMSASLVVSGADPDVTFSGELLVLFRVGEHAQGERGFNVSGADVDGADGNAGFVGFMRPADFDGTLAPGEEQMVRLVIDPGPSNSQEDARMKICTPSTGAPAATFILTYQHFEASMPMSMGMRDMAMRSTSDVRCE